VPHRSLTGAHVSIRRSRCGSSRSRAWYRYSGGVSLACRARASRSAVDRLDAKAQEWAKLVGQKSPINYRPARIYDYQSPSDAGVDIDRRSGAIVAISAQ